MRAILSVSDKTGLPALARGLASLGVEIVSTGGTARAIADAGVPVINIAEVTGFPEMMDGRVKTLHPAVFAGILARRSRPDDLEAIRAHGIGATDIVVVNLYPFGEAAGNPGTPFDELVEQIDIGGPSLLRAAAKNFRDVLVVVHPEDYPKVLEQLARDGGPSLDFRFALMRKAFMHTGQYDGMIAMTMAHVDVDGGAMTRRPATAPAMQPKPRPLRYGENPHQRAWWIPLPDASGRSWRVHQGKELSYTNLLDLDAAMRLALELVEPGAVVVKHTNPCGVATGETIDAAYVRARDADALSAFGGIVGLNRPVDAATATAIASTFVEAVIAPAIDGDALAILAARQNLRVVTTDFTRAFEPFMGQDPRDARSFLGGMLLQEPDRVIEGRDPWPPSPHGASAGQGRLAAAEASAGQGRLAAAEASAGQGHLAAAEASAAQGHLAAPGTSAGQDPAGNASPGAAPGQGPADSAIRVVTKRQPTAAEWTALRFAWRVCAHVKSNAVIFTEADRTLAIGAGQMSRVDAVKVAVMKAGRPLAGSVAASDAFFPFRDGLDAVADAGATAVVQPGGSVRDAEVIAAADERGLAMVFTGRRHFRH